MKQQLVWQYTGLRNTWTAKVGDLCNGCLEPDVGDGERFTAESIVNYHDSHTGRIVLVVTE